MIGRMNASCGSIARAQEGHTSYCHLAQHQNSSRLSLTPLFGQGGIDCIITRSLRHAHNGMSAGTGRKLRSSRPLVGVPAITPGGGRSGQEKSFEVTAVKRVVRFFRKLQAKKKAQRAEYWQNPQNPQRGFDMESDPGLPTPTLSPGVASPLGPSLNKDMGGVNFALFSEHATAVTLCIWINSSKDAPPTLTFSLPPATHRTGNIWHAFLQNLPPRGVLYAYQVDGPRGWEGGHRFDPGRMLLDPYAPLVEGRRGWGEWGERMAPFLGTFEFGGREFEWGEEKEKPIVKEKDSIVYEMGVRAFTAGSTSGVEESLKGTYLGIIQKIPYLKELGVNTVELLPVFEFDELEFTRRENPRDHLVNTWGYSTINFFAPMSRYAAGGGGAAAAAWEFKLMVKALHEAGIEVWLDVVYNHTNEAGDDFPYDTSFRGIDNSVYYMVDTTNYVQLMNYSGCGNTLNCNHPVVTQLILDSLRHWVKEYHVDGFRFDLASVLCRDTKGKPMEVPPLVKAIAKDPVLSKVKLIAEPWDCGGLYLVGKFPNWDRWGEWNGIYRDHMRRFFKGDKGMKSAFATRVSGSADLYKKYQRRPYHGVNFITAHDGFTLMDLVSYNVKQNEANGEAGLDGSNDNLSWNCGAEGPTDDPAIIALRVRQMKNFHVALMVSQGTPMVSTGDEYGHSRGGNNNSYGHDDDMNFFQWHQVGERKGYFRFYSKMIHLRNKHPVLGRDRFLTDADVTWHEDNWDNADSRFLAFTLHDPEEGPSGGSLYLAFNAHSYAVKAMLPRAPKGKSWRRVVDTYLASPDDFTEGVGPALEGDAYSVEAFSAILLVAK